MDKLVHTTQYNWCNYLSMLELQSNPVSTRGPCSPSPFPHYSATLPTPVPWYIWYKQKCFWSFIYDHISIGKPPNLALTCEASYNVLSWASYHIRHAPRMQRTFYPPPTSKEPLVSDPSMHHGTCVTHVPRCMSGSLTHVYFVGVFGINGIAIFMHISKTLKCGMLWKLWK